MKKIILGLCLASLLVGFAPVYAVDAPLTQTNQAQVLKDQLIQLLTQMIATLQAQLNQILAQQNQGIGSSVSPLVIENQVTQTPVEQTVQIVPKKELIVDTFSQGDCILMKVSVKDEDGLPFYGNDSYNVKVTSGAFPNQISRIGIMKDNNEYIYCPKVGMDDSVVFTIESLDLKKVVTITK